MLNIDRLFNSWINLRSYRSLRKNIVTDNRAIGELIEILLVFDVTYRCLDFYVFGLRLDNLGIIRIVVLEF
jgi:hypothetical protein